ncbi:PREDICTED: G-type lectin S-receptor-like serine/threonine-protein kinase SD3-1 [Tarenaya hassleriana]|uniref:G-type lectin S-receptor-like serine/threonine-protein kinase SD3-1 n=1 Tax=Tarenaya hassleriana TaxID=28532 RepID=UPI00053C87EA|nr:PREDICTED: G-type lectin S-receptor-like serine/threonine-protein kinase SD3-1 [Tarenaya hassleriana]XP_010524015.1 PREDICTED: G-type lectin S-receptor-like serine/threonine-protein kinase SD3-1 [Tarenaya hassleriana]XP_010524022.1 PREDICTED: G-type lectin S-receptor-like serine/threonine-protein kinase SD3-1 [Tarenaya hassleriana]XP_010524032.1 PREDICTED: G-type lectin S-receptor-like serine/threonine-protein kinase SD3-1 [Tarenaya hassleriana]XP_010524041.1 PREDICTED: G-type lectin S-recep
MMFRVLPLFLCLGFWALQVAVSEIPLGSRLLVGGEDSSWASPNGDFALGFFNSSDLANRLSIGIWFNSRTIAPDQRNVVWVAGADVTVSDNSYFELTRNGELVLFDSSLGVPVWNSKTGRNSVSSALLRDDGNLVLMNQKDEIVWQSFDTPSDTLLPGQKLSPFEMLRAASENSKSSYYSLHMADSGRLELRWESSITFWWSGNEALEGKNISAVLASEGALFLADEDKRPVWSAFGEDHNDTMAKFRFLRLDRDGNLRMYTWNSGSNMWKPVWQAIENQCRVFATCGQQVCSFNASGHADCKCPFRPSPISDPKCLAPYQQSGCKSGFGMVEFKHLHLYGIYPANDSVYFQISSDKCKKICLDNPSCTAVTYMNDGTARCFMKLTRYISGYSDPSLISLSYVKICSDPVAVDPRSSKGSASSSSTPTKSSDICLSCLVVGVTCTIFVLFLGVQIGIGLYIWRRRKRVSKKSIQLSQGTNPKGLAVLSIDEIKVITGNFKHGIGHKLFRGVLPENQLVAVKEMETASMEERKFRSSASKIGSIHHKNLAKLEAFCCELSQRFLVYEFAKNGSLLRNIQDSPRSKKLKWRKRVEICIAIAKALGYLHTECREFICHGNLNCENILLDENLEPKLTEFGFRPCSADKDVGDFGKTALTVVSGRCDPTEMYEWAYREWIEGRKETIVDKGIEGGFDPDELERVLRISFWCGQADERLRPSMEEVAKVLEGTLSVDPPPPPFAGTRSSSPSNSSMSGPI